MALSEIIGFFFLLSSCLCPVTLSDLAVLELDFLPCLSKLTITLNVFLFSLSSGLSLMSQYISFTGGFGFCRACVFSPSESPNVLSNSY